uniref:Myb-like domain-containing protein n=2 Tax=Vitis vinifera TaxID=29760 RepID=F6H2V6_VITVI
MSSIISFLLHEIDSSTADLVGFPFSELNRKMESTRVGRGFANSRVPKKEEIEYGMEQGEGHQSRVSSSRRTRSQLAPDWTINDSLILVNEIAAVEGECLNALSTYQKWKIIAENCTALDVSRTFNQCRRKWDSLLFEYNKIKKWESRSRNVSFWTLESERRRELGLPVDFERELFKAIDDLVSSQEVRSDTDPGTDPEAEDDRLEVIAEYGPKKQKRREMPQKTTSLEEKEQMMVMKLRENADLIDAIVKGNLVDSVDFGLGGSKNRETLQADFKRRQGDKLIACLRDIADTLDQLRDIVQKCG